MNQTETEIVSILCKEILNKQADIKTPVDAVILFMQMVETYQGLTGAQKSAIVVSALNDIVNDEALHSNMPPALVDGIKVMIACNLVQPTINAIVDASNGKFNINVKTFCFGIFSRCFA